MKKLFKRLINPWVLAILLVGTVAIGQVSLSPQGDITVNSINTGINCPGCAGWLALVQGMAPTSQSANTFVLMAPTSIPNSYAWTVPSAQGTGYLYSTNGALSYNAGTGGGGGGSPSTFNLSGPISNLPVAGVAGRVYYPTDSYYQMLRDNGTSWDYFIDGQKVIPPTPANFSWANQGLATVTSQANGASVINYPCAPGTNIRLWYETAPATPYTQTFRIKAGVNIATNIYYGVAFMESSTGKLSYVLTGAGVNGLTALFNYTNFTTFSGNPISFESRNFLGSNGIILRLGDTGSQLTYGWSTDGINFETYTTTRNAFFTTAPDRLGVAGDCEGTNGFTNIVSVISVQ